MFKIDNWYSQFLKTKKFEASSEKIDPRSRGEKLGEDALEQIQLALEKNYYPTDVMRLIVIYLGKNNEKIIAKQAKTIFKSDKLLQEKYKSKGFDDYLGNIKKGKDSVRELALENLGEILSEDEMQKVKFGNYLPESIVQKITTKYGMNDEKITKQLEQARYKPLDITFKMQTREAEKELVNELSEKGAQVVWDEDKQEFRLEGIKVEKQEKREGKFLTEEKILNELERLLKEGVDKGSVALGLAGDYITFVWQLKNKSGEKKKNILLMPAQEFDENKLRIEINNYLTKESLLAQNRNLSLKESLRKIFS